jgi:hypothetical protein
LGPSIFFSTLFSNTPPPSVMWETKFHTIHTYTGDRGSTVVKVLCYKSEGRWFDSRCCHLIFPLT